MDESDPTTDPRIAGLADGSLSDAEREALTTEVETSPGLRAQLREQQSAVALMRATDDIVAPASLRASINELTAAAPARRSRLVWRPRGFVSLATGLAVAIAAVLIAVQSSSAPPTVTQTAHLALAPATAPAPAEETADHDQLTAHVGSVRFPSYEKDNGWRASGSRHDTIGGRAVTTVFYTAPTAMRVGYSIVSGKPLADPTGPVVTSDGVRYVYSRVGSAHSITWWEGGHTCVIAGHAVSDQLLLSLATATARA